MKQLHIFAQHDWHDDAYIVGEREALEALRDAIDRVLSANKAQVMGAFVSDGEGFNVIVAPLEEAQFDKLKLPYTGKNAGDKRDKLHHGLKLPNDLISQDEYAKLAAEPWKEIKDYQ